MRNLRPAIKNAFMVAPSISVLLFIFVLPVAYFFLLSFWRIKFYQLQPDATLDQYRQVFASFSGPLFFTLGIALTIGLATTSIAFAFAYYCRFRAGRWGNALVFLALVTLFGGYLTKIYMWKTILGTGGILNSALLTAGIIKEPISAFLYNPGAVIITLIHYTLPLAVLPIFGALRGITDIPLEAARDLGASRARTFRDIVLPQAKMGILSAFSLSFIFSAGDYVTPLIVGGPNTSMIGLFIQNQFGARLNSPLGSAMSFVVIGCCILVILAVAALLHTLTKVRD